jgi:hypothetical protein
MELVWRSCVPVPPGISQTELLTDDELGATYVGRNPRALRAKLENGTSLLG